MKKYILLILITTTFFVSCNQTKNNNTDNVSETKNTQENNTINRVVALSLEPNVFKLEKLPETLNVKMSNNTNDTITTGLHYRIEAFENNKWTEVSPKDMTFNDIGYILPKNDFRDFDTWLLKEQINYKIGRYRIVKYYLRPDYFKTKESHDVYVEFRIE
jgi:hypothetical protein